MHHRTLWPYHGPASSDDFAMCLVVARRWYVPLTMSFSKPLTRTIRGTPYSTLNSEACDDRDKEFTSSSPSTPSSASSSSSASTSATPHLPSIDLSHSRPPLRSCRAPTGPVAGSRARHALTRAPPAAALWRRTWRHPPQSGGGGGLGWAERRRWQRLWHRLSVVAMASPTMGERTGHQPSIISRQPGVPPKQKLIWKMAPVASNIDRPSPHRVGSRGSICQLL
jgi:hypothetical protein